MNRRPGIRNLLIALALFCLLLAVYLAMRPRGHRESLQTVPDLSLTDLNGSAIHTVDYRNSRAGKFMGRVVRSLRGRCAAIYRLAEETPDLVPAASGQARLCVRRSATLQSCNRSRLFRR